MDYSTANWRIRDWFPKLSEQAFHDLRVFHVELLRINDKTNLISVKTLVDADLHHFADSIIAIDKSKDLFKGKVVHDIGSGNGFPGLVLAILFRQVKVVLVDSDLKKIEFMKYVAQQLKLTNVTAEWKKFEDLPDDSVEFGISRGFTSLPRALMLGRKCFKKGGIYVNMKSQEWPIEIASLPPQLCSTWNTQFITDYELPIGQIKLSLLKSERVK